MAALTSEEYTAACRFLTGLSLGSLRSHENFGISLLYREAQPPTHQGIMLEEAVKSGLVISEQETPCIEVLDVENNTGKDVIILSGEYVVGGSQNRVVATSVCLKSGYKGTLPVRCVEQGRWNHSAPREFFSGGHTPSIVRSSVHNQHAVWEEVSRTLTSTRSVCQTSNLGQAYANHAENLDSVLRQFQYEQKGVGVIAAIRMKEHTRLVLDIFSDKYKMEQHYAGILRARALEALQYNNPSATLSLRVGALSMFIHTALDHTVTKESAELSLGRHTVFSTPDNSTTGSVLTVNKVPVYLTVACTV